MWQWHSQTPPAQGFTSLLGHNLSAALNYNFRFGIILSPQRWVAQRWSFWILGELHLRERFHAYHSFQPTWVLLKVLGPATPAPTSQATSISEGEPMQIGLLLTCSNLMKKGHADNRATSAYTVVAQATSFTTALSNQVSPVYHTLCTSSQGYLGLYVLVSFSPSHYR